MRKYRCLENQEFESGKYKITPIRDEDKYLLMKWRNEQMYHLRQSEYLTKEKQDWYFGEVVSSLFNQENPNQLLFSYLENDQCIGYGGLVHINWIDRNAEISFIMDTTLEKESFSFHWSTYLQLIEKLSFAELRFHKIFTYAFDIRPHLYQVLEQNDYVHEATFKAHCLFEGKFIDVLIHSKINRQLFYRKATEQDLDLYFNWTNDPDTRANSFNSEEVDYQSHIDWFLRKANDKKALLLVFENDLRMPVGQVRIELKPTENIIGISIDKDFRGKGLAIAMINISCKVFFEEFKEKDVHAYIKKNNVASRKSFEKAGFQVTQEMIVGDEESYLLARKC